MTLSELVLLLQWEVQKSVNLVAEIVEAQKTENRASTHLEIERFEVTLPIEASERVVDYRDVDETVSNEKFRNFHYPLIVRSDSEMKPKRGRTRPITKGKVLDVKIGREPQTPRGEPNDAGLIKLVMTLKRSQ